MRRALDISKQPRSPKWLVEGLRDGTFGLPDFQRPSVWAPKQQIDLLDSLCNDLPIGVITVTTLRGHHRPDSQRPFFPNACEPPFDYLVLDGQQRLRALSAMCFGLDPHDPKRQTLVVTGEGKVVARKLDEEWEGSGLVPVSRALGPALETMKGVTGAQRKKLRRIRDVLTTDSIIVVAASVRTYAQAVELFERINSKGSRLAMKDLVAARLAEVYPQYITRCDQLSADLTRDGSNSRVRCFDRMVLTKSVAFAATGRKTAKAKQSHEIIFDKLHRGGNGRSVPVRRHLEATRKAGIRLREEIVKVYGLAGEKLGGVLDGNAALVAMQYFVTHPRPAPPDLAIFRKWLFTMLFSSYYTGGGTEAKVDRDLELISHRRPKWKELFEHAQEGAKGRGVIAKSSQSGVHLNRDVRFYSAQKNRQYLETLRRIAIANKQLIGWIDPARTVQLGDARESLQHVFPRRPQGTRRWKMGQEIIEHPANFATIDTRDNSSLNNQDPFDYLPRVSAEARKQQHIPPPRYWNAQKGKTFFQKRVELILKAVELRVNRARW